MKKVSLILILLLPLLAFSQKTQVNMFFDKYSGQEGYTSVYITKYMFQMFEKVSNDDEDKEFKEITSKLDAIKILTLSNESTKAKMKSFKSELLKSLPKAEYKDLMIIKDGKDEINFMVRDKNNKISELVMLVNSPGEAVLIFIEGDIDLNKISKLSKSMDIKGFKHLNKVNDN